MKWIYYKLNSSNYTSLVKYENPGFEIRRIRPRKFTFHNIAWMLLSFGRFIEHQIVEMATSKVVARAQVMPKIFIFGFMKKNGIHIGPCSTEEQYRGRGFYPTLLTEIILKYKNKDCYIFCDDENKSSIRGIEKVGFKPFAIGSKNKIGIYVIEKYI